MNYDLRQSLGRDGALGNFYDAYSDQLTGENLFQNTLPPSLVQTTEDITECADIRFIFSDTLAEKFEEMEVDTSTQLNVLCQYNAFLSGSGQFFIDNDVSNESETCIRQSIFYSVPTKTQQFDLLDPNLITQMDVDAIMRTTATHVVAKIKWGANTILTLKAEADSLDTLKNASHDLKALLLTMGSEIIGLSEFGSINMGYNNHIDFSLATDIKPDGYPLRTVKEALKFIRDIPSILKDNLGKPLLFFLVPVNEIQKILKFSGSSHSLMVQEISDNDIFQWGRYFDLVNKQLKRVLTLENIIKSRNQDSYFCDYPRLLNLMSDLRLAIIKDRCNLRGTLAEAILEARKNGNLDIVNQIKFAVWRNINNLKEQLYHIQRHLHIIRFCDEIRKPDIHGSNLNSDYHFYTGDLPERKNSTELEAFLLLTCSDFKYRESDFWEHLSFFISLKEIKKRAEMWIVDLEQFPQFSFQKTRIVRIVVKEMEVFVVSDDYYKDTSNNGLNLMYADRFDFVWKPPISQAAFKILCPRALEPYGCRTGEVTWHCNKCRQEVKYGFDSYFYCRCGKVFYKNCRFRCVDEEHGAYVKFDEAVLSNLLRQNYGKGRNTI